MEFIIISGLSGAGKSEAASVLEDMGFYCVDNMPAPLIPKFAEFCMASKGKYDRVALVVDIRGGHSFDGLFTDLEVMNALGCDYRILFMEASPEVMVKRYKATRRKHPLAQNGRSFLEAMQMERAILDPVRQRAEIILDTTALSNAKLRGELLRIFGRSSEGAMSVQIMSFGFKYGIPIEADLVFDVRFLPNPYYIAGLRSQSGLDDAVFSFVFGYQQTFDFMTHLKRMLTFLLPLYVEEGKTALTVAIGCTGGKHRSVAICRATSEFVRQKGYETAENHRDMNRDNL